MIEPILKPKQREGKIEMTPRASPKFFGTREKECLHCGKRYSFKATRLREGDPRFCSRTCWYEWKRATKAHKRPPMRTWATKNRRIDCICNECNKQFWANVSCVRKWCSWACYSKYRSKNKPTQECLNCGKVISRSSVIFRRTKRTYCGRVCMIAHNRGSQNPLWRGRRVADRGATWKDRSAEARKRDMFCQCLRHDSGKKQVARKESLSVDHIVPYRLLIEWRKSDVAIDPNDSTNLISLCRGCHAFKTSKVEPLIIKGDIVGFRLEMNKLFPMEKIDAALRLYGVATPGGRCDA